MLGVPKDILDPTSPPGRGILDGTEVQFAILGDSPNVAVQARAIQALAEGMRASGRAGGGDPAAARAGLADGELPTGTPRSAVIGVDDVTLGPAALAAAGTLLLAGPPGSGRTTALDTIATALRRSGPDLKPVFLTARRSALSQRSRAGWPPPRAPAKVADLADRLADRAGSLPDAGVALLIEHLTEFANGEAEFALDRLIKAVCGPTGLVVGEAETSTWSQAWTLAQPFKAGRRGLLLVPGEMDGDTLLGTPAGPVCGGPISRPGGAS